jgi:hypothetical protein
MHKKIQKQKINFALHLIPYTLYLIPFLLFSLPNAYAQELELPDLIYGKYRTESIQNLCWRPNTNQYAFIKNDTIFLVDAKTERKEVAITFETIKGLSPEKELGNHLFFNFIDENRLYFPMQKMELTNFNNEPVILT